MNPTKFLSSILALGLSGALLSPMLAHAEEGMWTFDNPPRKQLEEKYGFSPTREWLDHVRLASVRFNDGGSGSFVSPHGLVLTNHHVARGQLQKLSRPSLELFWCVRFQPTAFARHPRKARLFTTATGTVYMPRPRQG